MQKINFEDANIITPSKVTIDGVDYEVQDAQYQGGTDLNAETFNTMQNNIEKALINIYDSMWPIGRGFIDFTDTDYSNWLGFTWERELIGMTAVGLDANQTEFNTIGKTGGKKTHTLTIEEMPSHTHPLHIPSNAGSGLEPGYGTVYNTGTRYPSSYREVISSGEQSGFGNDHVGENQPHSILQPYKVVAYWKRVK